MKVKEVMTRDVKACALTESLADAAKAMWDYDCGILPVVKDGKTVVGLITDRDMHGRGNKRAHSIEHLTRRSDDWPSLFDHARG